MSDTSKTVTTSGGMGVGTVLTIVFIVLKLTGVINWAWVWVLAPLWISVGIGVLFFLLAIILMAIWKR